MSRPFALLLAGRLARFATHARGVMVAVSLLVPLLECQAAAPPHCTLAFTPYAKLPMRGGSHETLVFSPDGRTLAIGHGKDDGLVLYETASLRVRGGLPLPRKDDRTFSQAAFLNRGRWLAVSFASRVVVWDLAASKVIFSPVLHNIRVPARIAADSRSKLLATTEHDHAIGIWDVASGKELGRLEGHKKYNRGIAFSPDGKRIATAGSDTTRRSVNSRSCAGTATA